MAQAHKTQLATEGRDRAALVLLFPIHRLGPVRQGALADLMHADPSTVSRHVTALVERGLVRRVADESDGRASRLVITDAGHTALQDLCAEREARLGQAMAAWDPETAGEIYPRFRKRLKNGPQDTLYLGSVGPNESVEISTVGLNTAFAAKFGAR